MNTRPAIPPLAEAAGPLCIGVVTETFPPEVNGVAMTVERLIRGLIGRGHTLHLVRPHQGRGEREPATLEASITVVPGLPLPWYRGLRFGMPADHKLVRLWQRQRPDVLYVATEGPLGWSAVKQAERLRIPVISGFHTNFHAYSRHYGAGLLRAPIYRYLRRLHNRTAYTLVPTRELRDSLSESNFANVEVLGRGVDSRLFTPERRNPELRRQWGVDEADPVVLYVGRLAAEKNLPLALQAFGEMHRQNPRTRMVLVGDGPLARNLCSRHLGLILAGTQRGERLAEYYASADLFLFPSETETYGNVTAEAMASGLAVLAYDYAAAHLVIRHNENGLLARFGDATHFTAEALRLAGEPQLVAELRDNARRDALQLDWDQVVERFEELLLRCLRERQDDWALLPDLP